MNYDTFNQKKQSIDNQQKELKKKSGLLKKQKLQLRLDKFNKQKEQIQKSMNKFVNSPSSYD